MFWGYTLCVGVGVYTVCMGYTMCMWGVHYVGGGIECVCVCVCQVPEINITRTCSSLTRLAGWPVSPEIHLLPPSHGLMYKQITLSFSHGFKRLN